MMFRWMTALVSATVLASVSPAVAEMVSSAPLRNRTYVWAESSANVKRLGSREGVVRILDAMSTSGIGSIILEVKPVHGYVIYPSKTAPRLKLWKGYQLDQNFDVIATTLEEARKRNIRVLLGLNVFSEGLDRNPDTRKPSGVVFDGKQDWQAWNYAMPASAKGTSDAATLKPISEHGKSFAIFVSPHNPEVWQYELEVIRELAEYKPDGIVLDRVRYNNIESDFSPYAREDFQAFIGRKVDRWPEDILTWKRNAAGKPEHMPGPLFDQWMFFRARTIRDFFRAARDIVKSVDTSIVFSDYTGSWYGAYWNEGLNWGSPEYDATRDYKWAPNTWPEAAYAHLLDLLFSGLYFKAVTPAEAGGAAANSVEGAGKLLQKFVGNATTYVGSLNLPDYAGDPDKFVRAANACLRTTGGVMLFDLIYVDEYNWWPHVQRFSASTSGGPAVD